MINITGMDSTDLPKYNKKRKGHAVIVYLTRDEAVKLEKIRAANGDRGWSQALRRLVTEAKP